MCISDLIIVFLYSSIRPRGGSSLDSARKKARLEGVLGDSDSARAIFVGLDADS